MVDNANAQAIYQYYTIVNDSIIGNTGDGDYTFINNSTKNEDRDQIMYLSLEPVSSDIILNSAVMGNDDDDEEEDTEDRNIQDDSDDIDSHLPKIEFVLEDGQMYMRDNNTLNDVDENYTFDPEFIGVEQPGEEDNTNDTIENANNMVHKEVLPEYAKVNEENFMKIQLVDGSYAYINNTLWNSLMDNIKLEEKPKVSLAKKEKKISCTYSGCDKVYTSTHHLAVHMRNHTGSRPYQCPFSYCEKGFATGYSLKAHLRTHTGEAPYGCKMCPKHFKTSGDLQKHVRTHTGEKPFKCPIEGCGRSFTTSNIRKVHVRSHTGERPYGCTYPDCKKAFASATNFKNHMRIHSGEKPYKCPVPDCGKRFTEYSSLFKHNAVHKPFIPLTCEYCNQDFKHESTLRAHKQAMHKILVTDDGTEVQLKREIDGNYIFCSNE